MDNSLYDFAKQKAAIAGHYVTVMKIGKIARECRLAEEIHTDKDLDDLIQRAITDRVAKEMVPYLLNEPQRFYGALVVAVYGGEPEFSLVRVDEHELLDDKDRSSYGFGLLRFDGSQVYYALDGQHRLKSMQEAIRMQIDNKFKQFRPSDDNLDEYYLFLENIWREMLNCCPDFKYVKSGNKKPGELRLLIDSDGLPVFDDEQKVIPGGNVFMRPIGQYVIAEVVKQAGIQRKSIPDVIQAIMTNVSMNIDNASTFSTLIPVSRRDWGLITTCMVSWLDVSAIYDNVRRGLRA
jgi:hypothetical protein